MLEVAEGDELDDVPEDGLSFRRSQDPVVAVQHLHVAEVGVPDPDDDDRHGEVGGLDDGLPRVGHVGDDAVRQDQQDEVLLRDRTQTSRLIISWLPDCHPTNTQSSQIINTHRITDISSWFVTVDY